jgi:prepilin peptidase CpaA
MVPFLLAAKAMTYLPPVFQILLALLVITAAMFDFRERRIPNWLALTGVLAGIGLNGFVYEAPGLWMALKGMGLAMLVYFPLWLIRGMGAGDVKLMGAIGAIVGPSNWLGVLALTCVFGAVAGLVLMVAKGRCGATLANIWKILKSLARWQAPYQDHPELDVRSEKALRLPHAVAIAFGSLSFLIAATLWAPR